jgi:hypothetical protein
MTADPWEEFQAMTPDECMQALAYLAGRDPEAFARVLELSRGERERRRGIAAGIREGAKAVTG